MRSKRSSSKVIEPNDTVITPYTALYKRMKYNFNEVSSGILKFVPPTVAQIKKNSIKTDIFMEPLVNLQKYREYNSVEANHKRNINAAVTSVTSDKDKYVKKIKILSLNPLDSLKCPLPPLPEDLQEKQNLLVKPEIEVVNMVLPKGHAVNHVSKPTPSRPSHVYGKCKITDIIEETASYEGETDMLKIISTIRNNKRIKFFYLTNCLTRKSTSYHFYNLKVVSYHNINKEDFYMLSENGSTHIVAGDDIDHIKLDEFAFEYDMFSKIRTISTFCKFRIWKAYNRWKKVVRYTKFFQCRTFLEDHLFIISSSLRPALLNIREMCQRIIGIKLCQMDNRRTYTLTSFLNAQIIQITEVAKRLNEFRELVKDILRSACRTSLLEYGFFPDDYFLDDSGTNDLGDVDVYNIEELIDACQLGGSKNKLKKIIYDINNPLIGRSTKQLKTTLKYVTNCRLKVERKSVGNVKGKKTVPGITALDMDVYTESPEKTTYTQQASKRNHCHRLTCFIRLADYFIMGTLHVLAVNSLQMILNDLLEQLKSTPNVEEILSYKINSVKLTRNEDFEDLSKPVETLVRANSLILKEEKAKADAIKAAMKKPLFIADLVLQTQDIQFFPDRERFQEGLLEIIKRFKGIVLSVHNLVPDSTFDSYTRPLINNKFEPKTCGEGPSLQTMLTEDTYLQSLILRIKNVLDKAFDACDVYASTFIELRKFYQTNESTDLESLRRKICDETGVHRGEAKRLKIISNVQFFQESLSRYHSEIRMCKQICEQKPIGMILIDGKKMKDLILPSPQRCLDVINEILPTIARIEVDDLIKETQDAEFTLLMEPSTTVDYVNALTFLSEIQLRIEPLEREADVIKEMYELIDSFKVPTPPQDFAVYQTLFPSIDRAKNSIDKALTDRDSHIDNFFVCLDKEIFELKKDIKEIRSAVNNPFILDVKSNKHDVKEELEKLNIRMVELQTKAATLKSYQKIFKELTLKVSGSSLEEQILGRPKMKFNTFLEFLKKHYPNILLVEQPRMEDLDEVASELKLKQMLWNSLDEWDARYNEWLRDDFMNLNTEDLVAQTMKYVKIVTQLEKGLPPNQIIPLLKEKVESMRDKISVITNLLNPNLQERHWQLIENVIRYKISKSSEKLTLGMLIQLNAFEYYERLEEISGQASSEASLETLLKKVEEAWQVTEYVILPYKDSKDVFILGGTDEIQQLLDDSNINIATIASSRHVGPIKPRVDEWVRNLDLFGKTLEEWLTCQRNWLYLESIFSAPDIQRQLPTEAKSFTSVDKYYKEIMRKVQKVPLCMRATTAPGLLDTFRNNNQLLDQIQKCLEAYLESKRVVFPRFYFLSNDELLEILAQTRNPQAVQPHLRKCFDAISKLKFALFDVNAAQQGPQVNESKFTNDILSMISPEGEEVSLGKGLKARGNVEEWLGKVEEAMFINLRKLLRQSLTEYDVIDREEWLKGHANQIVLTVEQIMWCRKITFILQSLPERRLPGMSEFEKKCFLDLNALAGFVRGQLPKLFRSTLCALITVNVHSRDMVTEMVKEKVSSNDNFNWQKQLRYYWDGTLDNCVVRMSNSLYVYGYEYLGSSARLVITPLTDRCYLCLMGALQLDLGGAPAGPAGTGKTETTKDLAKSLAKQCVVFNCSDGLDYKMMGRFFSGLAQSGAWCCFDEFNRIDIEVLSVIAQQLITIRNAKASKVSRFMFEGREIKLVMTCAAFITMNPGYAGRTELPDNLKALFRPIAMMVPDYRLIAEVILYSEGFESSKTLAQKMTQMYKLCSEQLSQQDHYDFGMRALKSVLVMAGQLKRENPDKPEDVVLIRALRDSNLPKFLKQDAELFKAILQDLFPGVELPEHNYGRFKDEIEHVMISMNLQISESQVLKVIQFYETLVVRHGVMLVGPTGGGKTTVYNALAKVLANLHADGLSEENPDYQPVKMYILNPKSITMGELYGEVNKLTMEWHDGLMPFIVRQTCVDNSLDHQWVICDGPVDALWIENMNTVLDDNKMLCLANSERIKLTPFVHMLFEVQDLAVASPATVSRCGMVYVDPEDLGWQPFVKTWMSKMQKKLKPAVCEYLMNMFTKYTDDGIKYVQNKSVQTMTQVTIAKVNTICKLLESLLTGPDAPDMKLEPQKLNPTIAIAFAFCYLWGIGGNLHESCWDSFDNFMRSKFDDNPDCRMPNSGDLYSCYADLKSRKMDNWEKIVPSFKFIKEVPFFEMIVPTVDTLRFGYLFEKLLYTHQSVIFTGGTGVGKSVVARGTLNNISQAAGYVPVFINFSAQTSSNRTQDMIEGKMEKKRKAVLGAPLNKRMIIFIDDLNMPKLDTYGSQPPIELLRQFQDFGGFYDRDKLNWITIQEMTLSAACAPPGGGRNPVTPRFLRHFSMFSIPAPNEISLKKIFTSILSGFFSDFSQSVKSCTESIVQAAVEIYNRMYTDLLPTPTKSHYVFNLRDLSKCVQGMLQASPSCVRDKVEVFKLFCHEAQRVFHDRLINQEDKMFFHHIMADMAGKHFGQNVDAQYFITNIILFGDFMKPGEEKADRLYEQLSDFVKVRSVLSTYLDEYQMSSSREMKLVFFMDALEHIARIARMIRQDRGNALLVGVGGTGKQSLTRLAAYMNGYKCFQIELCRGYDYSSFHDDLKKMYDWTSINNLHTVFLFTDNQIVVEEFLEDINNILNSGEVPNLFEADEYEKMIIGCRSAAKEAGIAEGNRDGIFEFCINRVRNNLHVVLCMSPVGSAFRSRCRMFPSLVNCCTIDWFTAWPEEALLSVAKSSFEQVELGSDEMKTKISYMCTEIHTSVSKQSERFYLELKRHYYTTPTSYLELITLYLSMLSLKKRQLENRRDRVRNGLTKILDTNELIATMEIELVALRPQLEQKQKDTEILMTNLGEDQDQADIVREKVQEDESVAKVKAIETQAIADDAQKDLDEAMPALEGAIKALDSLDKNDISEIRVFTNPPQMVQTVMESVCLLLGQKTDWATAKVVLGDGQFLKKLAEYPKDNIPEALLKKLKLYIDNVNFTPENVEKVSKACKSLVMWVRAMDIYAKTSKTVEPKKKRLAIANKELDDVMSKLKQKQAELKAVENKIAELQKTYDMSVTEKKALEHNLALTSARLKRAGKLTTALADEKERWTESVAKFNEQLNNVIGDVFIGAACVAYYGAFTSSFRSVLLNEWIARCMELEVPVSNNLTLMGVLGDPFELRQWNTEGLPRDQVSSENAILVTRGRRWPLMIDPQEQANRWIRNKEAQNQLKVIKLSEANFLRTMEACIRAGNPVLLEDIAETLDPALEPILLKQTFIKGGRMLIHLGDSDVDYNKKFKLYITTKLSNPHYLPEICIKVTIINFTVTPQGLEDQLLSEVTKLERPELEEQRSNLIIKINNDKNQLQATENRILKLLFESEGNILDNEDLINTLNQSKVTSGETSKRLAEAELTEQKISVARAKYIPVAGRGSVMYFVVANMAEIDPMYQFSLKYFKALFNNTIEISPKNPDLEERLQIMLTETTIAVYNNVARGLFEEHKLVFSFMLCSQIMRQSGRISDLEWDFCLRGVGGIETIRPEKPQIPWLTLNVWNNVVDVSNTIPQFYNLITDIQNFHIGITLGDIHFDFNAEMNPDYKPLPPEPSSKDLLLAKTDSEFAKTLSGHYDIRLNTFQKLIMIKTFCEEKMVISVNEFVKVNLGPIFIEPPATDLPLLFLDMNKISPLVFVLSTGSDPMSQFQRFAKERNFLERVHAISLGQGQGPVAEKLMDSAIKVGDWVFLQNCHLAASWMIKLEDIVKKRSENPYEIHEDYRLFLSSMPSTAFPISVLQNSVKVTNEPPKGLRANIRRAFNEMTPTFFETHVLGLTWRKLIFGLCFFHAIILDRKKFGPLGWNIRYEFSDSDRECAILNLNMFCSDGLIQWDALMYITSEITYGGRVTDFWDQRCLGNILQKFFHPKTLGKQYKYSESGIYYPADIDTLEGYKDYVDSLPLNEEPEIFGMHENANLAFQIQETQKLIHTILEVQPRIATTGTGRTTDDVVFELADQILSKLMDKIDPEEARSDLFHPDDKGRLNSLTTVLMQEVDRFNKLLFVIKNSLDQLKKAIKGFVVMSEELESMYGAFTYNQVPELWAYSAYPSLKLLSSWVKDLVMRCSTIHVWLTQGAPKSFWLPGFFFPQGFLTGTLQNYARKYDFPIDHLSFDFIVHNVYIFQEDALKEAEVRRRSVKIHDEHEEGLQSPKDGVLVHGLFMDGFRWDDENQQITDSIKGEMLGLLPVMHMMPKMDFESDPRKYVAPLYKTEERAGVLSTTGMSTNFVVPVPLKTDKESSYWINMGAALVCENSKAI